MRVPFRSLPSGDRIVVGGAWCLTLATTAGVCLWSWPFQESLPYPGRLAFLLVLAFGAALAYVRFVRWYLRWRGY